MRDVQLTTRDINKECTEIHINHLHKKVVDSFNSAHGTLEIYQIHGAITGGRWAPYPFWVGHTMQMMHWKFWISNQLAERLHNSTNCYESRQNYLGSLRQNAT